MTDPGESRTLFSWVGGMRRHPKHVICAFGAGALGNLAGYWLFWPLLGTDPMSFPGGLVGMLGVTVVALVCYGLMLRLLGLGRWDPFE